MYAHMNVTASNEKRGHKFERARRDIGQDLEREKGIGKL